MIKIVEAYLSDDKILFSTKEEAVMHDLVSVLEDTLSKLEVFDDGVSEIIADNLMDLSPIMFKAYKEIKGDSNED